MSLMDILNRYADPAQAPHADVEQHFEQAAEQARPEDVGQGVAAALRSDATPPFGQTVGNLFGRSDPQQQAGVLNQLIQSLGSGAFSGMAGSILGKVLGDRGPGEPPPTITPSQASTLSPTDVATIATNAQSQDDSVIDRLGAFYAQHPTLVKSIGAAGLALALGHMRSKQ
jgi:hypothetical protein